jgi:DNA invertase Pin-like site-specific DNA recombinase
MRRNRQAQAGAERRALGYVRCSTAEQARSSLGLGAQEERIRGYAAAAGLELVDIFGEEGVSGSVPLGDRPGGAILLERLRSGEARHLVALKLDRLFRDAGDCLGQTRAWDRQGIALHFLDLGGQALYTASAMGRMLLTLASAFAELERNMIGERTAQALSLKRQRGEKTGGDPPYGFALGPDGRTLVPVAGEQVIIAKARKLEAQGLSLRGIGAALAKAGHAPRGGRWYPTTVARLLRQPDGRPAA